MSRFLVPLLLAATLASAQTVTTEPAVPAAGEPLTIHINGIWRDSCVPVNPRVLVANREIFVTYRLGATGGCLSVVSNWTSEFRIPGGLAAGTYTMRVRLIDDGLGELSGAPSRSRW